MELFATIALSWPTAVFSVLLMVVIAYWLLAMLGLVDLDILHFHVHPDGEAVHFESLAGLLLKYGLEGVPITLVFTCVVFYGWIISYFGDYYLLRPMPADALRYLFGTGVLAIALVLAVPLCWRYSRPYWVFARGFTVFCVLSLLTASVMHVIWGWTIWGWIYCSTDYVADFNPFFPITREWIEAPCGILLGLPGKRGAQFVANALRGIVVVDDHRVPLPGEAQDGVAARVRPGARGGFQLTHRPSAG